MELKSAEWVSVSPRKFLTNHDLTKLVDTSDEWITTRTGIKQRHMVSEDEGVSQMAAEAAQQALEMASVNPKDVGLIICGTFTADYKLPSAACLIQDRLGATNAGAFDINSACTGFHTFADHRSSVCKDRCIQARFGYWS